MGTVKSLAEEVERGLCQTHPGRRQTVIKQLARAVGAMLQGQTPNTVELASLLPLETERQDRREQWLRRLLKKPLLRRAAVIEPFARQDLEWATRYGHIVLLSLDQTELGTRLAGLLVSVWACDRSLPLAGVAEAGAATIGLEGQRRVVERVRAWLPAGAPVWLSAARFSPAAARLAWRHTHGWCSRLRLKRHLGAAAGHGAARTPGEWAREVKQRYLPRVQRFAEGVLTNVDSFQEAGPPEPWSRALECLPTRAAVLEYSARWGSEPRFADCKHRGFDLEDSQVDHPDRLERLMLIMSLAM